MLRARIGDDAWWRGISSYYRKYRNATATTDDLRREMEAACECDLATYFNYWLYTGSVVKLDGGWRYDAASGQAKIELARSGHVDGSPDMSLEAAIYYADSPVPDVVSIPIDRRGGRLDVDVRAKPVRVLLDPNTRLLAEWTFEEREL